MGSPLPWYLHQAFSFTPRFFSHVIGHLRPGLVDLNLSELGSIYGVSVAVQIPLSLRLLSLSEFHVRSSLLKLLARHLFHFSFASNAQTLLALGSFDNFLIYCWPKPLFDIPPRNLLLQEEIPPSNHSPQRSLVEDALHFPFLSFVQIFFINSSSTCWREPLRQLEPTFRIIHTLTMHQTALCGDVRVLLHCAPLHCFLAGKSSSKKKEAKSRSARARGSAVVVAEAPGTTSVVTALLCRDPLAKEAPDVLQVYPLVVVGRLLRFVCAHGCRIQFHTAVLLDLPFALRVRQLHEVAAVWPFAGTAWPFESAASAAKLPQGVRTQRRPRHNGVGNGRLQRRTSHKPAMRSFLSSRPSDALKKKVDAHRTSA